MKMRRKKFSGRFPSGWLHRKPEEKQPASSTRQPETIPINCAAETIYLLGLVNQGWGSGAAFWSEHPELHKNRTDQMHIGSEIGWVEIRYSDDTSDTFPLTMAVTAGFSQWWMPEPFNTRKELSAQWGKLEKLRNTKYSSSINERYYLAVQPRKKSIKTIIIHDNPALRGRPLISAITLKTDTTDNQLKAFGNWRADADDLKAAFKSFRPVDWSREVEALSDLLLYQRKATAEEGKTASVPQGY